MVKSTCLILIMKRIQFSIRRSDVKIFVFCSFYIAISTIYLNDNESILVRNIIDGQQSDEALHRNVESNGTSYEHDSFGIRKRMQKVHAPVFKVILIVRPLVDRPGEAELPSDRRVKHIFASLSGTDYEESIIDLDVILDTKELILSENKTWDAEEYFKSVSWTHGNIKISECNSNSGLEYILSSWNPRFKSNESVAFIDTGFVTKIPRNWFKFITSSLRRFGGRQDVIAVSTQMTSSINFPMNATKPLSGEENVILWQGVETNSIIVPHSVSIWRSFVKWLQRNVGDWYLWPTVVSPSSELDYKWNSFNGSIYASWQYWLSRFSVIHDVYVLYPRRKHLSMLQVQPQTEDARKLHIPKFNLNGHAGSFGGSRISLETIHALLDFAGTHGNTVSFTIVNSIFISIAKSWICNVDVGHFRPPGIVWITTDDESYEEMKQIPDSYAVRANELEGAKNGTNFGSFGYWLLMLERTTLVRDILNQGCTVFLFETDQVWLRDPLPYIHRLLDSEQEIDLIGTLDAGRAIGGNFLIIKPTITMRKIYMEICQRFENNFVRFKDSARLNSLIQNDQSILSKLVLYEEPFRSRYPVLLRILDTELFACGKWYEGRAGKYNTLKSRSPILINNNWLSGISKKTNRLKQFNHWFLDENGICSKSAVHLAIQENEERAFEAFDITGHNSSSNILRSQMLVGQDVNSNFSLVKEAINMYNI